VTKEALETLIGQLEVSALIFGALVVIGVAGETFFGVRIWWNNRKLQAIQRSENSALQLKVSEANYRAIQAESHLGEAKSVSAQAEQHAAEAVRQQEALKQENLRLQFQVEEEKTARLKLEEYFSDRVITDTQASDLAIGLQPLKGKKIIIAWPMGTSTEITRYANRLIKILHEGAGMDVGTRAMAALDIKPGISLEFGKDRMADLTVLGDALVNSGVAEKPLYADPGRMGDSDLTLIVGPKH